eukprot:983611-Alexandrium_andersonii.AAC.2
MGTRGRRTRGLASSRAARTPHPHTRQLLIAIVHSATARDLLHDAGLPRRGTIRPPKIQASAGNSPRDARVRERLLPHTRSSPPDRFPPRVPEDDATPARFARPFHDALLDRPPRRAERRLRLGRRGSPAHAQHPLARRPCNTVAAPNKKYPQ